MTIQCNLMALFFDPTFRPVGGAFFREYLLQDFFSNVYNCVTVMFTFVAMVTIDTW